MSSAEDTTVSAGPPVAGSSESQSEEFATEPVDGKAARPNRKAGMKTNMVAREVLVSASGVHPGKTPGSRELFTEESSSVLVHENGGVVQLSTEVTRGQLLLLGNVETKREVVAQVKRTYRPMNRCVELEFAEPTPRFWGIEFSVAAALLPKAAKDTEAAAQLAAEGNPADAGEAPAPPTTEEVEALRREVRALRGEPDTPSESPATEHAAVPMDLSATEKELLPKPSLDFSVHLPTSKGLFRARGKLTPGAGLRLAALSLALVVTIIGAVSYKRWIPSPSWARKASGHAPAVSANVSTSVTPARREAAKERLDTSGRNTAVDAPAISTSKVTIAEEAPVQPKGASDTPTEEGANSAKRASPAAGLTPKGPARSAGRTDAEPAVAPRTETGLVPPKLVKSVRAVASLDDLHDFETGNVVIDAVVDTEGAVHFITVISGPPSLRHAAVEAVKQYQYEPATRNGQPVPEHVHITIRFRFES